MEGNEKAPDSREASRKLPTLNPAQRKEVANAPTSCRGILERAYTGNSRTTAIKAMCLRCVGYVRADVRGCTALGCPLWGFRPFQTGDEVDGDLVTDPQETASV